MIKENSDQDFILADKICQALRSGNCKAIIEIYQRYHQRFKMFAKLQLGAFTGSTADDVLHNFYIELMNGKAICSYNGKGKKSLYSYLLNLLRWRILDEIRSTAKYRYRKVELGSVDSENNDDENALSAAAMKKASEKKTEWGLENSFSDPEHIVIQKQYVQIIHEALFRLEKISSRDANYIKWRIFDKMNYREMAHLEVQNNDPKEIQKRENAIKKQFTRDRTGSLAKFKIILGRLKEKYDIAIDFDSL